MAICGSYSYPWDGLTEQQQTARLDRVLDWAERFAYNAQRDVYRAIDATQGSPDYCPATAAEQRRKARDSGDDGLGLAALDEPDI